MSFKIINTSRLIIRLSVRRKHQFQTLISLLMRAIIVIIILVRALLLLLVILFRKFHVVYIMVNLLQCSFDFRCTAFTPAGYDCVPSAAWSQFALLSILSLTASNCSGVSRLIYPGLPLPGPRWAVRLPCLRVQNKDTRWTVPTVPTTIFSLSSFTMCLCLVDWCKGKIVVNDEDNPWFCCLCRPVRHFLCFWHVSFIVSLFISVTYHLRGNGFFAP